MNNPKEVKDATIPYYGMAQGDCVDGAHHYSVNRFVCNLHRR